jgi:hypothetical protein
MVSMAVMLGLSSCNDYLEVYPENVQPTDLYWSSKEDVEATLMSGYLYLRQSVTDYLIPWGELRAGCIYSRKSSALQQFQIKPTTSQANWAPMYRIVNTANLVLKNASKAYDDDDTYTQNEMNSHLCEAYWLRSLAYFYIVRNWRDAPLFTEPFETDEYSYNAPQSSDTLIIAQIKADLKEAIRLDAAKEAFNTTWETKGRATKWAIYALMADVCLWNQDFDEAIQYANAILNSHTPSTPTFMALPTHTSWFTIFNPGNSNESIYEVQWSHEMADGAGYQTNNLPIYFSDDTQNDNRLYQFSAKMRNAFNDEFGPILEQYTETGLDMAVRTMYGSYKTDAAPASYQQAQNAYVWKYIGGLTLTDRRMPSNYDPNFIIYRVSDIMLLKAEALVMRHMGTNDADNKEALELVNQIRTRTNVAPRDYSDGMNFNTLLGYVLYERIMELAGEGKVWYDLLRVGRYKDPSGEVNFKKDFFIDYVTDYNTTASESWIRSVLSDEDAWYLPVYASEINANNLLVQNRYYQ